MAKPRSPEALAFLGLIGPEEYIRRSNALMDERYIQSAETKELKRQKSLEMWKTRKRGKA